MRNTFVRAEISWGTCHYSVPYGKIYYTAANSRDDAREFTGTGVLRCLDLAAQCIQILLRVRQNEPISRR